MNHTANAHRHLRQKHHISINLSKYLNTEELGWQSRANILVVVIMSAEKKYGLIIDSLVGQQEIVIKPISSKVNQESLINGATVFGDGRIAMILNIDQIVEFYLGEHSSREFPLRELGNELLSWESKK